MGPSPRSLPRFKIARLYYQEEHTLVQIGEIFGCSPATILYRMESWGMRRRGFAERDALKRKQHEMRGRPRTEGTFRSGGKLCVYVPGRKHKGSKGCIPLYVLIAEEKLGRQLLPGEVVHHRDGDSLNECAWNLCVLNSNEHQRVHRILGEVGIALIASGQRSLVLDVINDPNKRSLIERAYPYADGGGDLRGASGVDVRTIARSRNPRTAIELRVLCAGWPPNLLRRVVASAVPEADAGLIVAWLFDPDAPLDAPPLSATVVAEIARQLCFQR